MEVDRFAAPGAASLEGDNCSVKLRAAPRRVLGVLTNRTDLLARWLKGASSRLPSTGRQQIVEIVGNGRQSVCP